MFWRQRSVFSHLSGVLIIMTTLIYIHETHKLTLYARTIKSPDTGGHANAVSAAGTKMIPCI